MKTFRNKKAMWVAISEDIANDLGSHKTADQCQNRFKTIKKRRTERRQQNASSGANPVTVPYDEEFRKIKSIDDSVEPELLRGPGRVEFKSSATCSLDNTKPEYAKDTPPTKKQKVNSVCEMMWKIHMHKEEQRERRHKEKLEVLRSLLAPEKGLDA